MRKSLVGRYRFEVCLVMFGALMGATFTRSSGLGMRWCMLGAGIGALLAGSAYLPWPRLRMLRGVLGGRR